MKYTFKVAILLIKTKNVINHKLPLNLRNNQSYWLHFPLLTAKFYT